MENVIMEIDSIPVILDGIRKYDGCYMSRCSYFIMESDLSAESNALSPNWMLMMQALNVPFYLLELSGIIWKPLGDSYIFDSPDSIRDLFDAIDSSPLLRADTSDIWLPGYLFKNSPKERGSVYRIQGRLFSQAYSYQKGRISPEQFLEFCEESRSRIAFSELETRSFSAWRDMESEQYEKTVSTLHSQQQRL